MFNVIMTPRIGETDALGHINNCVIPVWFEHGRTPLFRVFDPELKFNHESWHLIMVHADYDYIKELHCRSNVEIKTWITKIGTKSFTSYHEAWQEGCLCVKGSAVMVYYDFIEKQSKPIPSSEKAELQKHIL